MFCVHPGNYYLGWDLQTNRMVRLEPSSYIPTGCVRIKSLRQGKPRMEVDPYDDHNLPLLKPWYWSLPRVFCTPEEPDFFGD